MRRGRGGRIYIPPYNFCHWLSLKGHKSAPTSMFWTYPYRNNRKNSIEIAHYILVGKLSSSTVIDFTWLKNVVLMTTQPSYN